MQCGGCHDNIQKHGLLMTIEQEIHSNSVNELPGHPASIKRSTHAGIMLCQRRRRWANIIPGFI